MIKLASFYYPDHDLDLDLDPDLDPDLDHDHDPDHDPDHDHDLDPDHDPDLALHTVLQFPITVVIFLSVYDVV